MRSRPAIRADLRATELICLIALLLVIPNVAAAQGPTRELEAEDRETIQMGISTDLIPVNSNFAGAEIAVFGAIENADRIAQVLNEYSVVVVIRGPSEDVLVRRKERVFGVWMNRQARTYRNVPSFYAVASNRRLDVVAPNDTLRRLQIGVSRLSLNLYSAGTQTFILPAPQFSRSLRRLRIENRLFSEDPSGVAFLGTSLFRATLNIPSDVPIGTHTVTAYLFRDGQHLSSRTGTFQVRKQGFEELVWSLAHDNGVIYGLLAVLVALVTGWLGSVVFGRGR